MIDALLATLAMASVVAVGLLFLPAIIELKKPQDSGPRLIPDSLALNQFLVVDHLGRIAGCHSHNFAGSIFDLPKKWKSPEFKQLRESYHKCTQCNYLCYVFYSLHGSPKGHLSLAKDQWKNAKFLFKKS